ncbi:hypothetical protein OF83DRAFT_1179781 [Amylostereum chailletii]|nr:hypothetical protein OF83DRAFT_1179781 [Amylostereum chailletii]
MADSSASTNAGSLDPVLQDIRTFLDRPPQQLRTNASLGDYQRALQASQRDNQTLQGHLKTLIDRNAAFQHDLDAAKTARRKGTRATLIDEDKEIGQAASAFYVMGELFIEESVLDIPRPMDIDPMSPTHYSDGYIKSLSVVAELYSHLSPSLQVALAENSRRGTFAQIFLKRHSQERSNTVMRLRACASDVFKMEAAYFRPTFNMDKIPTLRELLIDPDTGRYDPFAPLLFKDKRMRPKDCFRNEKLPQMLRGVLVGEHDALTTQPAGHNTGKIGIWKVKGVTAGAIASITTMTIFICSSDPAFTVMGGTTKINYPKYFEMYKSYLLRLSPEDRVTLFAWWNHIVFRRTIEEEESEYVDPNTGSVDMVGDWIARHLNLRDEDDSSSEADADDLMDTVEHVSFPVQASSEPNPPILMPIPVPPIPAPISVPPIPAPISVPSGSALPALAEAEMDKVVCTTRRKTRPNAAAGAAAVDQHVEEGSAVPAGNIVARGGRRSTRSKNSK